MDNIFGSYRLHVMQRTLTTGTKWFPTEWWSIYHQTHISKNVEAVLINVFIDLCLMQIKTGILRLVKHRYSSVVLLYYTTLSNHLQQKQGAAGP